MVSFNLKEKLSSPIFIGLIILCCSINSYSQSGTEKKW